MIERALPRWARRIALIFVSSALLGVTVNAQSVTKTLTLSPAGTTSGPYGLTGQTGQVVITAQTGRTILAFTVTGLRPNAVYTCWMNLDTSKPPFVTGASPTVAMDPETGTRAEVNGATPAAADNAGFVAGNGLDPNGFITDADGKAAFTKELNYDIFKDGVAPVVLRATASQTIGLAAATSSSPCVGSSTSSAAASVDSGYMRVFNTSTIANPPAVSPGFQVLDAKMKPRLVRGTVRGFSIVDHFDGLTHGHVAAGSSGCNETAARLSGTLANATP